MSQQLTYALITPLSLHKARTGGILSRLLSRSGLRLIGARVFSLSQESTEALAETFSDHELTAGYLNSLTVSDDRLGALCKPLNHSLVLLFQGENAVQKVSAIVGDDTTMDGRGETLRDTYGNHVLIQEGEPALFYFEPGVIAPTNEKEASEGLAILKKCSDQEGGILDASESFSSKEDLQKTLVLIKPDNFLFPNTRPGGVIDLLARTGLALVGVKVHHMSVAQAMEFYGPVLDVLVSKLPDGRVHWESIIEFMSGKRPSECSPDEVGKPGSKQIVALIYQGPNAIQKIREALGPTDPSKAPHGTIRKEFGQDIMVNGAHASDSPESVDRETAIININDNNFKKIIMEALT